MYQGSQSITSIAVAMSILRTNLQHAYLWMAQGSFANHAIFVISTILLLRFWTYPRQYLKSISYRSIAGKFKLSLLIPILSLVELFKSGLGIQTRLYLLWNGVTSSMPGINESVFPSVQEFDRVLTRIEDAGCRTTGSEGHDKLITWIEAELRGLPGVSVRSDSFPILRWQPPGGLTLKQAGNLSISVAGEARKVQIAGAVPFSLPTSGQSGQMVYIPNDIKISSVQVKGKVVLRDFPLKAIPYALGFMPSYSKTADLNADLLNTYDRPGFADEPLHRDLLAAGRAGAAGMIIIFDLSNEEIESYFEPHKGTHYELPAVFVGVDEAANLKAEAAKGTSACLSISAHVSTVETRNVIATLQGQISERIIYLSHTDGNTLVQENGPVSLLALITYFSKQPLSKRRRTLEFAFNSGHLHISREGSLRHAKQLDNDYQKEDLVLVLPIEHLGTREIEPVPRSNGKPGRELRLSGRNEVMFWCVGPSPPVLRAVQQAVERRNLDRVVVTRGVSIPNWRQVPTYTSFGGIGGYYHNFLIPTTSLISGPWSLWAPSFGRNAVDLVRLRSQTLALGDVYASIDDVPRDLIAGGYRRYRKIRESGGRGITIEQPPEQAQLATNTSDGRYSVKY